MTPLVTSAVVRLLAAATLATFPNDARLEPTIEDRHDGHPDTLRRAMAFIDSNVQRDVSVLDIAAAAFVTPRAVQLAFRRHLGTTPMRYLRTARPDAARADLEAATPGESLHR